MSACRKLVGSGHRFTLACANSGIGDRTWGELGGDVGQVRLLTQHGYNAFFDYEGIASGDFENVILENIRARAHFLVLLTPSALERCSEPRDWLRQEIETALESGRNIVPIMLEGFDFSSPAIASQLTGKLSALKGYNALRIPAEYFAEAMDRLRTRSLNVSLSSAALSFPLCISDARASRNMGRRLEH
jgi:TIR domain